MHRLLLTALATPLLASLAAAAVPPNGTVSPGNPSLTYSAGPFTSVNVSPATGAPDCALFPGSCDDFQLTVDIPASYISANPDHVLIIQVAWPNAVNDFDVYLLDAGSEAVQNSAATSGDPEIIIMPLNAGTTNHIVRTVAFSTVNESVTGTVSIGPRPTSDTATGIYAASNDIFTCNRHLTGQSLVFNHGGDGEPAVKFDKNGDTWITGIAGVGGGIGLWKIAASDICAQNPIFLDNPDAGVGGGDTDVEVATQLNTLGNYNIYTSSLTLANVTSSTSFDGGATFVPTAISTPTVINDRQWNAAYGVNTLYLSWREGATNPGNALLVARSSTGGTAGSFVGPFPVWTDGAVNNTVAKQLGNMACDVRAGGDELLLAAGPDGEGNVYHGFTQNQNEVWVAVSRDFGTTWSSSQVFQGAATATFDHIFTWVAVDLAGNVYTVWSDNNDVFYSVSQDLKTTNTATWSKPVRVNNGPDVRTGVLPMVEAGAAGNIVVAWYATSANSSQNPTALWHYYHARIADALNPVPTVEQLRVSDHVVHTGVVCQDGLSCSCCRDLLECQELAVNPLDGSSMVSYAGAGGIFITRQVAGVSALGGALADNSAGCPTLVNGCAGPPPPVESSCILPGISVLTDPTGDHNTTLGNAAHDLEEIWIAEPFVGDGVRQLVFSMRVNSLDPDNLPLNGKWNILWTNPDPTDPMPRKWVALETCDVSELPSWSYGHIDPVTNSFQGVGPADGTVHPDGLIEIRIDPALVGNPQINQILGTLEGDIRLFVGALCSGLVSQIDGGTGANYTVRGNSYCKPHTVDCAADFTNTPGDYPVDFVVNNPSTTARSFTVSLSDNNGWLLGGPVNTTLGPISPGSSAALQAVLRIPQGCAPTVNDVVDFQAVASDLPTLVATQSCMTLATCDQATPTLISRFEASADGEGVELLWSTHGTADVTGWNLYRAQSIAGPWARLTAQPLPVEGQQEFRFRDGGVASDVAWYRLNGVYRDGAEVTLGTVSVSRDGRPLAFDFGIAGANPFRGGTEIEFALPERSQVRLDVFSVNGRRVRTLAAGEFESGRHSMAFQLNDGRHPLEPGVYFARIKAGTHQSTLRLIAVD